MKKCRRRIVVRCSVYCPSAIAVLYLLIHGGVFLTPGQAILPYDPIELVNGLATGHLHWPAGSTLLIAGAVAIGLHAFILFPRPRPRGKQTVR